MDSTIAALLPLARDARENGRHYNGFKVGCLGYGPNGEIFLGANFKPTQDAEPLCSEEQVMLQAAEAGVILRGLIVVGQPRVEDTTRTLHCCGERCRPAMRRRMRLGAVVEPETRIVCVNSITGAIEEFTVLSLHEAHGETLD